MRFVQPRTESQQAMRALHRVRESLVQDKVKTTNQMHAFLLEFGISVPRGAAVISRLSTILEDNSLPLYLSQLLLKLQQHYHYLVEQIKDLESQLKRKLDEDEVGQRLLSIPCVGTLTASTISTEIGDGSSTPAAVTLRRQQGLYLGSTAREVGRHCWELVSEVIKRSELCWFNVPGYSYKNWNTSLANWPIGSGIYCAGKATLSSLVLWQTSWPE
jgi:transposase